jgi:hypothetical protein
MGGKIIGKRVYRSLFELFTYPMAEPTLPLRPHSPLLRLLASFIVVHPVTSDV